MKNMKMNRATDTDAAAPINDTISNSKELRSAQVLVKITPSTLKKIDNLSKLKGTSKSSLIADLIEAEVSKYEKELQQYEDILERILQ